VFYGDAVLGTLYAPRSVTKIGRNTPQRHKKPAPLWQPVIARCRLQALPAATADSGMGLDEDLDLGLLLAAAQPHLSVHETDEPLYPVQDGLKL
jgi:hypothetical protein